MEHGDTPKVEEPQGEEVKEKNQGEEIVATGSATLPDPIGPSVDVNPYAFSLALKWREACFRRSKRRSMPKGWTLNKAMKALEGEFQWIRNNRVDLANFDWRQFETVLDFIDRDAYLAMNIKSPDKLSRYWKNGRVMEVVIDTYHNSKENKFMRMAKNAAEELMEYREEDWTTEGILRRARNGY